MARSFVARADGRFMCFLEPPERHVIRQVSTEIMHLIRAGMGIADPETARDVLSDDPLTRLAAEAEWDSNPATRGDHAFARLFPPASEDPEQAEEFRRLSAHIIADSHVKNLATILSCLEANSELGESGGSEMIMSVAEAHAWLKGLTVIRLVLGERMHLRSDDDFEALKVLSDGGVELDAGTEPGMAGLDFLAALYEFLTWLQESLVKAFNSRPGAVR